MIRRSIRHLVVTVAVLVAGLAPALADQIEKRVALVIGNAGYKAGPLTVPANDAGLIAQTLQAAGFDVAGARDLDGDSLRHTFRDFVDKVSASGPDTVAFIYLAGYGLQYEGENYFVPVDAGITRDVDVLLEAVRLSDYLRPLNALPLKARFFVLDAARDHPFARNGKPLASGLALIDPEPGLLVAFNAAPGTVATEGAGPYGPYAQALAEMIREGGLEPAELFDRVRQRVNTTTNGDFIPWTAARLDAPFVFFERAEDAPPPAVTRVERERRRARAVRDFEVEDAYHEALDRDTLDGYLDFLEAFPRHPLAKRVRVIVAARREAITWRRTYQQDSPRAYWSYLDRYPDGPHAWDARRRLRYLAAELEAPPSFVAIDYDVPPPPREEFVFVRRRFLAYHEFDFAPPPPPPIYFVPPPPPEFAVLVAPSRFDDDYTLPVPFFVAFPRWCAPPRYVAQPPQNIVFNNIHNPVVVNNVTNITNTTVNSTTSVINPAPAPAAGAVPAPAAGAPPAGGSLTATQAGAAVAGAAVAGAALTAAAVKVALPPAVARKAALTSQNPADGRVPGTAGAPLVSPNGQTVRQLPPRLGVAAPGGVAPSAAQASPSGPSVPGAAPLAQGATSPPAQGSPAAATGTGPGTNVPVQGAQTPLPPAAGSAAQTVPRGPAGPPVTAGSAQPAVQTPAGGGAPTGPPPAGAKPADSAAKTVQETAKPAATAAPTAGAPVSPQGSPATAAAPADRPKATEPGNSAPPAGTSSPPGPQPTIGAPKTDQAERGRQDAERRAEQERAAQAQQQRQREQQAAQEAQRRAAEQERAAQAQQQRQREQQAAQEAQRRAAEQQRAAQAQQQRQREQQAAQEAQRRAAEQQRAAQAQQQRQREQQAAQEAQRRAAEQQRAAQAQQQRQREQQAAQEAQRRAAEQQRAAQAQQQKQKEQAAKQAQQAKDQKKCGVPGTPPCP